MTESLNNKIKKLFCNSLRITCETKFLMAAMAAMFLGQSKKLQFSRKYNSLVKDLFGSCGLCGPC